MSSSLPGGSGWMRRWGFNLCTRMVVLKFGDASIKHNTKPHCGFGLFNEGVCGTCGRVTEVGTTVHVRRFPEGLCSVHNMALRR